MEPDFPVEIFVNENPRSLQGGARGLGDWKTRLAARLRQRLPEMAFLTDAPVRFVLRWFPDGEDFADLDNVLKPIIDASVGVLLTDDSQVQSIVADVYPPSRTPEPDDQIGRAHV